MAMAFLLILLGKIWPLEMQTSSMWCLMAFISASVGAAATHLASSAFFERVYSMGVSRADYEELTFDYFDIQMF